MQDEVLPGSPDFGTLLRQCRLAAGLSQEGLAERARMSPEGISALERGFRRSPQRETISLLAGALELSAEQRREFENAARSAAQRRHGSSIAIGPWTGASDATLPLTLTSYIGRQAELNDIKALVDDYRLVTLTGVGGIGKTQTALRLAQELRDAGAAAVCFVGLQSVAGTGRVAAAIASAVGVQQVPNRPLLETLLGYLEHKALLLVLDNCEHVIAEAQTAAQTLLRGCPQLKILATTREPLRIAGERVYRIPALSLPPADAQAGLTVRDAAIYDAIALFADRARAINQRFALTDENVSVVAAVCRRLDGIPLAIELAAARTNVLSLKALNNKLDERLRLLARGQSEGLPRQDTMAAAIDWSYRLLPETQQRLFERLSVFAGGSTLGVATRVCADEHADEDDVLDLLAALVDKSLVVANLDATETRYSLLESFRQYAREKLATRGEEGAVVRRHAVTYLEIAEDLERVAERRHDEAWREMILSELDNWRVALEWALTARNDVLLGQKMVGALNLIWLGYAPAEGRRWLATAHEAKDDTTPTSVLAALYYAEANVALVLGEHKEQLASAQSALSRYRAIDDAAGIARAQSRAGHALIYLSRLDEAIAVLDEALGATRSLEQRRLVAWVLRSLGLAHARKGDFLSARGYVAEALSIYESLHADLSVAASMDDLGEYEFLAGNVEVAVAHATTMVAVARGARAGARSIALALNGLAMYLIALARYDDALVHVREALEIALKHELSGIAAHALEHLAAITALREHTSATVTSERYTQAALILGFVDARLAAMGSERLLTERQEYDRTLSALRHATSEAAVANAMASGATMTQERAVETALHISQL
jgi:predicted ATPase/transcriptional regulator with XRE-family HTH domain